jgi:hypothetical protein
VAVVEVAFVLRGCSGMDQQEFDIASFLSEVLVRVERLHELQDYEAKFSELFASTPAVHNWSPSSLLYRLFQRMTNKLFRNMKTNNKEHCAAKGIIARIDMKRLVCSPLQDAHNDVAEIATILTQTLVPLVLTSEISMPLDTVVFAKCADEN